MSSGEGVLLFLLTGFLALFIIIFLVAIIFHILMAIGLYKIAKREGKGDIAWLAWIPVVNQFLVTLLVEDEVYEPIRGKFTLIYGITIAVAFVLAWFLPFVGIVTYAMFIYAFYFIAKRYSHNETIHVVFAAISLMITMPIQFFIFRNRKRLNIEDKITIINE